MPVRNGGPCGGPTALRPKANHRHIIAYDDSAQAHSIRCEDADALLLEREREAKARRPLQPTGGRLLRLHSATEPAALRAGSVEDHADAIQCATASRPALVGCRQGPSSQDRDNRAAYGQER